MGRDNDNIGTDGIDTLLESLARLNRRLPRRMPNVQPALDPGPSTRPVIVIERLTAAMHLAKAIINADPVRLDIRRDTDVSTALVSVLDANRAARGMSRPIARAAIRPAGLNGQEPGAWSDRTSGSAWRRMITVRDMN